MKKITVILILGLLVLSFFMVPNILGVVGNCAITIDRAGTTTYNFTSNSCQSTDSLYIKCTITNAVSAEIKLYKDSTIVSSWALSNTEGNYWETTITGLENHYYSFDVYATDTSGNSNTLMWSKPDWTSSAPAQTRKYVKFSCAPENINYKIFYLNKPMVYDTSYPDWRNKRIFNHDQWSSNGGYDVIMAGAHRPTGSEYGGATCAFESIYLDDSVCINPLTINNYYYHLWTGAYGSSNRIGWDNQEAPGYYVFHDPITWSSSTAFASSPTNYNWHGQINTWYLQAGKGVCTLPVTFTTNNIYDFVLVSVVGKTIYEDHFVGFIIINLPSDSALQGMDSDSDGLTDYQELFVSHTDPFFSDTDADGLVDLSDSNPNWAGAAFPVSDFSFSVDDRTVTFTDCSVGAVSRVWSFGDGITSTLQNPVHTYSSYGSKSVKLTVYNTQGSNYKTKTVTLVAPVEVLDQQQTTYISTNLYQYQSFVPTVSDISKIMINLKKSSSFTLSLLKDNTVLSSVSLSYTVNGWNTFNIPDTAVTPGSTYTIRLYSSTGIDGWVFSTADSYTSGVRWMSYSLDGLNPISLPGDFTFKVYGYM